MPGLTRSDPLSEELREIKRAILLTPSAVYYINKTKEPAVAPLTAQEANEMDKHSLTKRMMETSMTLDRIYQNEKNRLESTIVAIWNLGEGRENHPDWKKQLRFMARCKVRQEFYIKEQKVIQEALDKRRGCIVFVGYWA